MKSKYFSKNFVDEKDITSLQKLNESSNEQLSGITNWFNKRDPKKNRRLTPENVQVINELCEECNIKYADLKVINSFVMDITERAYLYEDELNNIIEDIVSQGGQIDNEKIQNFFDSIKTKGVEFAKYSKLIDYERRDLPVLSAFRYDVNLRLIPDKEFESEAAKIADYKPEIESLLPIAIFEIVINDGQKRTSMNFQLNIDDLEEIIGQMQACQKQLRLLEKASSNLIS